MNRYAPLAMLLLVCGAFGLSHAQQPAKPAEQAFSPKDLSGVWGKPGGPRGSADRVANERAEREQPIQQRDSQWSGERLPFTPEGRAVFDTNKPTGGSRQVKGEVSTNDPRDTGNPLGLYRTLQFSSASRAFEFGTLNGNVVQMFSVGRIWRIIYMDGRPVPKEITAGPFWFGQSFGKWEGDTLVVVTQSLDDRQWMDGWGTPLSVDARIEERWRRVSADELQLTITVNDPTYYSKPWTSLPQRFRRQPKNVEPEEIIYAPMDIIGYGQEILLPSSNKAAK